MLYSGLISSVSVVCMLWLDASAVGILVGGKNTGHLAFLCFMSKDCISFGLPSQKCRGCGWISKMFISTE